MQLIVNLKISNDKAGDDDTLEQPIPVGEHQDNDKDGGDDSKEHPISEVERMVVHLQNMFCIDYDIWKT